MALERLDRRRAPRPAPEPPAALPRSTPAAAELIDSTFEPEPSDPRGAPSPAPRWMGWRLRLLVACVLLGCLGVFSLIRALASAPHLDAAWRAAPGGELVLAESDDPLLAPHVGHALTGIDPGDGVVVAVDALAAQRSARWMVDDAARLRQQAMQARVHAALARAEVTLLFDDGVRVRVHPRPRGLAGLSPMFWLLCYFGLALYLVASVTLLAHPQPRNALYLVMAWCQAGNLILIAVDAALELGWPAPVAAWDMPLRMAFDLVTAGALVNAVCLHPRRLPHARRIAALAWAGVAVMLALAAPGWLPWSWWSTQIVVGALGTGSVALLGWSYRIEPHPVAIVLKRLAMVSVGTWALLTLAIVAARHATGMPNNIAAIGATIWYVFVAALLLLVPFLARSQPLMREFLLLAAVSTIATALDLLFVTLFSLGPFASLTLSLFISLAVYSGARQWILNQLLGSGMLSTERMFEQLYRVAREVEAHPERTPALLSRLLRELFEPIEVTVVERHPASTRIGTDGSSLLVPVPSLTPDLEQPGGAVLIRFAHRGRRLFTAEDARLTDRIVEQLRRAVVFDKAVEQGRKEERLRLAQDLHDDIGARLLTLMYKAQSPEMEDYVRHTLQDLKTLTRGLAASNHRLSHAAAEWKADLTQRLTAADVELTWSFVFDADILLTVVQWSALTRVLRELVSNTIAHSRARTLVIDVRLEGDELDIRVTDDGVGREPRAWSHGLGLGGIRKRVKQLGGEVEWREVKPHGISCRVMIRQLSTRA